MLGEQKGPSPHVLWAPEDPQVYDSHPPRPPLNTRMPCERGPALL